MRWLCFSMASFPFLEFLDQSSEGGHRIGSQPAQGIDIGRQWCGHAPARPPDESQGDLQVTTGSVAGRPRRNGDGQLAAGAQEERRIRQQARAHELVRPQPAATEVAEITAGQLIAYRHLGERARRFPPDATHRQQVFHHRLRGQAAGAHVLLHGVRDLAHQAEVPRDPARATSQPARQVLAAEAVVLPELHEQPAVLERARRFATPARALHDQRLRHAERPHHHRYRVARETTQRSHALVPVDHYEPAGLLHHHDRHLLAGLAEGAQESPLRIAATAPQAFEPEVELVVLHLHGVAQESRHAELVLRHHQGKSSEMPNPISNLASPLILLRRDQDFGYDANEISHLHPDLVLREVPG